MFSNTVKVEWIVDEPRMVRLLEDVIFTDPRGVEWLAPKNSVVDGASIPEPLWSIVGSPYVGRYRRATVLHDVYCETRARPHELVHQMFYEAMIEDKVPVIKAEKMYLAVALFGPKWDEEGNNLQFKKWDDDEYWYL